MRDHEINYYNLAGMGLKDVVLDFFSNDECDSNKVLADTIMLIDEADSVLLDKMF